MDDLYEQLAAERQRSAEARGLVADLQDELGGREQQVKELEHTLTEVQRVATAIEEDVRLFHLRCEDQSAATCTACSCWRTCRCMRKQPVSQANSHSYGDTCVLLSQASFVARSSFIAIHLDSVHVRAGLQRRNTPGQAGDRETATSGNDPALFAPRRLAASRSTLRSCRTWWRSCRPRSRSCRTRSTATRLRYGVGLPALLSP